jgi:hypothetical protein
MVKPIFWMPDAVPSMDCPVAPVTDDFEDNLSARLERLAEPHSPVSESGLQVHGALLNVVLRD